MFEWYEDEVRGLVARTQGDGTTPAHPVAFYGSSSIRLWDTLGDDFAGVPLVNLGFGGSTLAACDYYLARVVAPLQPRSIIFYAGDNDLGDGQKPDAVVASFVRLHRQVAALPGDIPFGFIAIKPSVARAALWGQIQETNRRIQAEIATRPQSLYLDVWTPMLGPDGGPRPDLFEADGLHMMHAGYRIWWQVLSFHQDALCLRPPAES